jgi:CDP-6-deoxy-D-xylo-4-hexulose-3-dehydrase
MNDEADALRDRILGLVAEYHAHAFVPRPFVPGKSPVPVAGRVFDVDELRHLVDASLDFWLTAGRFAAQFETEFARVCGQRHALLVNSGSSANLLAIAALTSARLGDRKLEPGDEVITVAAGFPTTVNPIFQQGLVPVFVDVSLPTYNVDVNQLEEAVGPRTRGVILAHTLGNPFDLAAVKRFVEAHNLWLVEDCCDALGATYAGQQVGTFGDFASVSFYPAHHITMGEGGCVLTNQPLLKKIAESFRDWGRDCWCEPGKDDTCGRRFDWQLGQLPRGYDHKYTYSHIGYNLKATDMQAAVGIAQLRKLETFIAARRKNFARLWEGLSRFQDYLLLPEATANSVPSWFGFPIAIKPEAPFTRAEMIAHLERNRIGTRLLFGGNLTRQPAYQGARFRTIGDLENSDFIMHRVFWIGVYPGLTDEMIDHQIDCVSRFLAAASRTRHGVA